MEEQAFSELVINLISWIESLHEKNLKYEAQVESLTLDLAKAKKTNEELEARLTANNIVVAVASGDAAADQATISTLTTSPATTAPASQLSTTGADLIPQSSSQLVHHVQQQQQQHQQQHLQHVPPIQHHHIQATQHQQAIQQQHHHHQQQQQQQPTQQAPIYQQLHNPQHAFVHQPQYVWTTYDGVNGHQVPSYYEYTIPSAPIAPAASTTAFQQQ